MKRLVTHMVLAVASLASGCGVAADPETTFERIWTDYDEYYGMFEVKDIDWDAAYELHRPRVTATSDDAELYAAVTDMLAELDDRHVSLYPATSPALATWSVDLTDGRYVMPPFDRDRIVSEMLLDHHRVSERVEVGRLEPGIGWLHLSHFDGSPRQLGRETDDALRWLGELQGLVVDIRDTPGGYDPAAQAVAARFADQARTYMTVRKRNGPDHDDFTPAQRWVVSPDGDARFTGPIVLLTSDATQSAAETFALAMRELPHVTQLGDTTSGAFSDAVIRDAPNGWAYAISVGDYRAADGRSYESLGLSPDIAVDNDYADVNAGRDAQLQAAVARLMAR